MNEPSTNLEDDSELNPYQSPKESSSDEANLEKGRVPSVATRAVALVAGLLAAVIVCFGTCFGTVGIISYLSPKTGRQKDLIALLVLGLICLWIGKTVGNKIHERVLNGNHRE